MTNWTTYSPRVISESEFSEISHDFSNPLEIFREALHNAYDWDANKFMIEISVKESDILIIKMSDDGLGMNRQQLEKFWNLGDSESRSNADKIGEKGHGTKIYLKSEKIVVKTYTDDKSYESACTNPQKTLLNRKLHKVKIREIENPDSIRGTEITIWGYNQNEREMFRLPIIKDYLLWFSKLGTIENHFIEDVKEIDVQIKLYDESEFTKIDFGHPFPDDSRTLDELWEIHSVDAHSYYSKKYKKQATLRQFPEIKYEMLISVEGQAAKESYNPVLKRIKTHKTGQYRASDRYGLYLCKDFIPIQRKNDWIKSFGSGSNSYVLIHGFINCQKFRLTANRGSVTNTDIRVLNAIQDEFEIFLQEINRDNSNNGLYHLKDWAEEVRSQKVEIAEYKRRTKLIKKEKQRFTHNERTFFEPRNESELFGLFMALQASNPEWFEFEPIDYNTNSGIDMLGWKKEQGVTVYDSELRYIELKYHLKKSFNHGFENIQWILCWEKTDRINNNTIITSTVDKSSREFKIIEDGGTKTYWLQHDQSSIRIQVFFLKEIIINNGITFEPPPSDEE